jgi:hypothetical protein
MSRVAIAALALTLTLAVASCGSSSQSIGRLRGQATRICQGALAQSDRIAAPSLASGTAAFLRRGTYVLGPELAQLRALRPPSDQADTYSAALAAASRQLTILDGTIHQLDGGADPLSLIKTLQRRLAPTESAQDAAWRTLGVPACLSR